MKGYLLPWEKIEYGRYQRSRINKEHNVLGRPTIIQISDNKWQSGYSEIFETLKDAMIETDKYLINNGWILIPEGKEDVYKCLI